MPSSRTALCGCFLAPSVVIREGAALFAFRGVAPPAGARDLYARIAAVAGASGLPLAWLESAGGRGGFFRGDLVAVGEADVRALASAVATRAWMPASEAYAAVVRVLLAHEIGHAVQAKLNLADRGIGSEQEADLTAGWIAESLGWPEAGDALVLDGAGSRAPAERSSHPSSAARVHAYREGRRMRRERRWSSGT